jgi:hypothetical protein
MERLGGEIPCQAWLHVPALLRASFWLAPVIESCYSAGLIRKPAAWCGSRPVEAFIPANRIWTRRGGRFGKKLVLTFSK